MRIKLWDERGFTFIELMLALVLMSILFLAAWGIFTNGYTFWRQAEFKVDMYDSLRISLDRMGRELMFARQPFPEGVLPSSNNNNLCFKIDYIPTSDVPNPSSKKMQYYCLSNYFYCLENNSSEHILAGSIQSVNFNYYNSTCKIDSPLTDELARTVRQVEIILTTKDNNLIYTMQPGVLPPSDSSHLYFEIDGTPTKDEPNPNPKKIHYFCSSGTLYRQVNNDYPLYREGGKESPQPLASDIQNVVFTYYDNTGAVVNPASFDAAKTVRQVKIDITAQKKGSSLSPVVLSRIITLRSF